MILPLKGALKTAALGFNLCLGDISSPRIPSRLEKVSRLNGESIGGWRLTYRRDQGASSLSGLGGDTRDGMLVPLFVGFMGSSSVRR